MYLTLIIFFAAMIFFVWGIVRAEIVGLIALLALIIGGVLPTEDALKGFSSPIIFMIAGILVVGGGIFNTGLAELVSRKLLSLAGNNENKLFILILLVTSFMGAFISNAGTVAVMLPIVVSIAQSAQLSTNRFLMPMAFASSMGGMLTLIGAPPNMFINQVLISSGYPGLALFSFFPVGVVCVTVGIIALIPLSKILVSGDKNSFKRKSNRASPKALAAKYQLFQNLYRIVITENSPLIGKTLQELAINQKYSITVVEILRNIASGGRFKRKRAILPGRNSTFKEGDIIYAFGLNENISKFTNENHLNSDNITDANIQNALEELHFDEIGIAELVILSSAKLLNVTVDKSKFRERYGINILCIQRGTQFLVDIKDEKLEAGDVLLIQGEWKKIAFLSSEQTEWVIVGQPLEEASRIPLDHKAPIAAFIFVCMLVGFVTGFFPPVTVVIACALAMILTGCYRNIEEAYKTINWGTLILVASMLSLATAIERTGISALVAQSFVRYLGVYGPLFLLAGIYITASVLTFFISNTAVVAVLAPVAMSASAELGLEAYPFIFAVVVGASMCFMSPFSTPSNALVMSAGRYSFIDYVKVGFPLQVILAIAMVIALPIIFGFNPIN